MEREFTPTLEDLPVFPGTSAHFPCRVIPAGIGSIITGYGIYTQEVEGEVIAIIKADEEGLSKSQATVFCYLLNQAQKEGTLTMEEGTG